MTKPAWSLRIRIRKRFPSARAYQTGGGYEIRLSPSDPPIAAAGSRDEAWHRAWAALDEMEVGHE